MFNPNNNSYKEISSTLVSTEISSPELLQAMKIDKIISWIKINQRFFSDLLSNKLFSQDNSLKDYADIIKPIIKFKKELAAIINADTEKYEQFRDEQKKLKRDIAPQNFHSIFLDSILGTTNDSDNRSALIGNRKDFSPLRRLLEKQPAFVEFLSDSLPKLDNSVKAWEKYRFPQFSEQIVNWVEKNKPFLKDLLNFKVTEWLKKEIDFLKNALKNSHSVIANLKARLKIQDQPFKDAQKQYGHYLEQLKQSNVPELQQGEILKLFKLGIEKINKSMLESKFLLDKECEKIGSKQRLLDTYTQYGDKVHNFLSGLGYLIESTKKSSKDLFNPESLKQILSEYTLLLKFLDKQLPFLEELQIYWKKTQNHVTTEMDGVPAIDENISLKETTKNTKRSEPEDGKEEAQVKKELKIK